MPDYSKSELSKLYKQWLMDTYGSNWFQRLSAPYGEDNPYYNYWVKNVSPARKTPTPADLTLPQLADFDDNDEYLEEVNRRLVELLGQGAITEAQAEQSMTSAFNLVTSETAKEVEKGQEYERYESGLASFLQGWVNAGAMTAWKAQKIIDDARVASQVKGVQTQELPYYNEVSSGLTYEQLQTQARGPGITPEEMGRRAEIEKLRATGERGIAGIPQWSLEQLEDRIKSGELTEEQVLNYIEKREGIQARQQASAKLQRAWRYSPPQPEYQRAFTETSEALAGPEPYQEWFGSRFPSIARSFEATLPKFEQKYWGGMYPQEVEKQVEESWAEYLRKRVPAERQKYASQYPYGAERYPSRFAPRIQTVQF